MTTLRKSGLAIALCAAASGITGCAATAPPEPETRAHTEAVVIDFYLGTTPSAACSGTLLAQNVVLTAAHCAERSTSARVIAPNAGRQTASVSRVFRFDWIPNDPTADPARQHDLALLVLREPIKLDGYAKIAARPCMGCEVRLLGRTRAGVTESARLRIARETPAGHPLDLFVDHGIADSGGGVVLQAPGKEKTLAGISVGQGVTTGGGYIARLDDPVVQDWVRAVVYSVSRANSGASTTTQSADDPTPPDDPASSGAEYSDPIDPTPDPTADPTPPSDPDPTLPSNPDPTPPSDPDPASNPDPTTPPSADPDPTPPSDPDTPGTADPSVPESQAPTTPEDIQPNAPPPPADNAPSPPPEYGRGGQGTYEPSLYAGQFWYGDNLYIEARPDDDAFFPSAGGLPHDVAYLQNVAGPGVAMYGAHGFASGEIMATDNPDVPRQLMANNREVIMTVCFAGQVPDAEEENTTRMNNAYYFAQQGGGDPARVYACTRPVIVTANSVDCRGQWVDGYGAAVSEERRMQLNLRQCTGIDEVARQYTGCS